MPEKDGRLTAEEKARALKWIEERCGKDGPKCPMCACEHWILSDHFTAPPLWGGGYNFGGVAYPCISIICIRCGHQSFFNATTARVLPPDEKAEKQKAEEVERRAIADALRKGGPARG